MKSDLFGGNVSLSSDGAVQSWNEMQMAFLSHGASTPTHLGAVLTTDPEFALAHAVKGLFCLMLGRSEMVQPAIDAAAAAKRSVLAGQITRRERHYVEALDSWLDGSLLAAISHMEAVLREHPQDSLALKISHAIRFILGDVKGMRASIEAVLPAYGLDHPAWGYVMGCHAFSLEETGEYAQAERTGRQAVLHTPNDAWGLHAVAHVFDMTGDSAEGLKWLNGREEAWSHCNNFRFHVWWHKALMHLDRGEVDAVLALYDAEIRKEKTDDYRDISNGTSLLMRLELDGVDVGNRWEEMADFSAARTEDGCLIFADLHYLLALMGGRREDALGKLMSRIQRDASNSKSDVETRMANPGVAAAAGLEAFGDGNYKSAYLNLAQARQAMQSVGGSHAQRDVFERVTIDAGIRAGFLDDAKAILDERKSRRSGVEDGYAAARYEMISQSNAYTDADISLPAE